LPELHRDVFAEQDEVDAAVTDHQEVDVFLGGAGPATSLHSSISYTGQYLHKRYLLFDKSSKN
jgi:hypothetical protein